MKRDVIAAPMSYQGSRQRTRRALWDERPTVYKVLVGWWLVGLIELMWGMGIFLWYLVFGILVAPYRIMRRGSRKRKADQKREDKRHQEMLEAIKNRDNEQNQKDT